LKTLKSDPKTGKIPVIVVTSKTLSGTERAELLGHAFEIVGKEKIAEANFEDMIKRAIG
jgi:hypothetical protein